MKRNTLKGWLTLPCLVLVLAVGTFANGGIIVSEKPVSNLCTETAKEGIIVSERGIIAIISDVIKGFLVTDTKVAQPCAEKNGIIVSE